MSFQVVFNLLSLATISAKAIAENIFPSHFATLKLDYANEEP